MSFDRPRKAMLIRSALAFAAASAIALVQTQGCQSSESTSLYVRVDFDPNLTITQLRLTGAIADQVVFGPADRPEREGPALKTGQAVRILLRDSLDGQRILVWIDGLLQGVAVASTTGDTLIRRGAEVTLDLRLDGPPRVDGGYACGSCANACCSDGACHSSDFAHCGTDGGACVACQASADQCVNGRCRCGAGDSCRPGQVCVQGACRCTPASCSRGCCSGDNCLSGGEASACGSAGQPCQPCGSSESCDGGACSGCAASCPNGCCSGRSCREPSLESCGTGGRACEACDDRVADRCAGGECRCGSGPACAPGQRCRSGTCVCDEVSCPAGCCNGTRCEARMLATCGTMGSTCVSCSTLLADNCSSSGVCRCGVGPACVGGQVCQSGQCLCTAASCAAGCCNGNRCETRSLSTCGIGGGPCVSCNPALADNCSTTGTCRCGTGAMCGDGQVCQGAQCRCTAGSCPTGCCMGTSCRPGTQPTACGQDGGACQTCDSFRADNCGPGYCRCGSNPPCQPGQQCLSASCVCNPTSCDGGCCSGPTCQSGTTSMFCGRLGAPCQNCGARPCDAGVCT